MMEEAAREFAGLLKERDNKTFEPVVIGKVITASPLKVNDGDDIILDEELIITLRIQQLITSGEIKVGNEVLMIANADLSKYIVVDKVV